MIDSSSRSPEPKISALLIVDMQNDFVLPGAPAAVSGAYDTIPKVKSLLDWQRSRRSPVFHVTREYRSDGSDIEITRREVFLKGPQYVVPGTSGAEIVAGLAPAPNEYRIVKPRFSAFFGTELDLILRRLGVVEVILSGTQYPNCIRATAFDAISLGYQTIIVTDATSAASEEIALSNIRDLLNVGIQCVSFDELKQRNV